MLREIGSNFWYCLNDINDINDLHSPTQFGCGGNDYAWLSTGRSATRFILDTIERHHNTNKVVVLPPFTCHTVIEPFIERRYEIFAYNINKTFSASAEDIINVARKHRAGVILFHRYFGFDTANNIDDMVEKARAEGIVTIEDCTQILYSSFRKSDSDYKVGSIRKWCGVPDGGFAVCRVGEFINKPKDIDLQLQGAKSKAAMLKYDYIVNGIGEKRDFLDCFQNAENILDAQNRYYKISDLSARIQSNLNVDQMKQ